MLGTLIFIARITCHAPVPPGTLFRFHCFYDVPFAAALGAAAMFSDLLFLISQQYRFEYLGDGLGEKVDNVS